MDPKETAHRLQSAQLRNERTIWIREPREASTARHLTIILDAELYRDRVGAVGVIDELQARGSIADSWFVFVSHASTAARWIECPCHPPFARFVNDELLPWLEALHPAITACTERVLAGLSYTGLAAAYVALHPSGRFTKVISQSGSFWWNDCWLIAHVRPPADLPRVAFHLDVGRRETAEMVRHKDDVLQVVSQLDANRRMRDALRARGCVVRYLEFDGGHDFAAWEKTLPGALQWALPDAVV